MSNEQPVTPQKPDETPRTAGMPAAEQARGREQVVVRFHATPAQQKENDRRMKEAEWPHCSPNSVYIAAIGNHWREKSWAHVMNMMHAAQEAGIMCVLEELQDRCLNPYDGLGTMRNEAWLKAEMGGYEWLLYVDNDILPPADALIRLIKRQVPIIAPYVEEPPKPTGEPIRVLHGPTFERFTGMHVVKWHVLSMFLMRTALLRPWGGSFWSDAPGADEGFHSQKLYTLTGVQPLVDTECVVAVAAPPTYPLTVHKLPPEEKEAFWQGRKDWLYGTADRRPLDPSDKRVDPNGIFLPFLKPPETPLPGQIASNVQLAQPNGSAPPPADALVQVKFGDLDSMAKETNALRARVQELEKHNGSSKEPVPEVANAQPVS